MKEILDGKRPFKIQHYMWYNEKYEEEYQDKDPQSNVPDEIFKLLKGFLKTKKYVSYSTEKEAFEDLYNALREYNHGRQNH